MKQFGLPPLPPQLLCAIVFCMCGIVGYVANSRPGWEERVRKMTGVLSHRGPDDEGVWRSASGEVVFGHRRLSILDLSPEGHQPMASATGRFVITFNGEIYNFLDLRAELETAGHRFRGHSDTEIMLAAFESWGVLESVKKMVGMFAFAVWDEHTRTLSLARDRIGEKPLFFGWQSGAFLFASELKGIRAYEGFSAEVDRDSLASYMRFNYVPAPLCILKGFYKLPAGCVLTLSLDRLLRRPDSFTPYPEDRSSPRPLRYWSARECAERGVAESAALRNPETALEALEAQLRLSIKQQMIADVPLGAFLSGGIDSSTIVALMQAQSTQPVKTFSIGFHEGEYNEAHYAKEVARHLGTDHTEMYVTPAEALDVIPLLPKLYDEPFSDSSQIPTYLVSKIARSRVTVSLSGDGGDELFCGYDRHSWSSKIWGTLGPVPNRLRSSLAATITAINPAAWDGMYGVCTALLPQSLSFHNPGHKLHRLASMLKASSFIDFYSHFISHWDPPGEVVLGSREPTVYCNDSRVWPRGFDRYSAAMLLDLMTYLPEDIMVKVDRASMGVALESRAPLLDHRVVELIWKIPIGLKMRGGSSKWLLRKLLYKYVPPALIERPKMGFGVPIKLWLKRPLKEWAESLLDESRLRQGGFLNAPLVRQKWREHLEGRRNWSYFLWDVLMFQAWLRQ